MKVLCIHNGCLINSHGETVIAKQLIEGELYTVIYETKTAYDLAEAKPEPKYYGFLKERFIKVSSIDETEFVREYKKELV